MQITNTKIEDYIASLAEEKQPLIKKIDELITQIAPEIDKVLWEGKFWGGSDQQIIGYGKYVANYGKKNEVTWFKVGLAAQKNYITVFVNAVEDNQYVAEKYKDQLGKVKVGKSSISFTKLEDINLDVLAEVIQKAFELMA